MARTPSSVLVDRILGGTLRDELTTRRAAGESYDTIARWLAVAHDIQVTSQTVSNWCATLGVSKPEAASA